MKVKKIFISSNAPCTIKGEKFEFLQIKWINFVIHVLPKSPGKYSQSNSAFLTVTCERDVYCPRLLIFQVKSRVRNQSLFKSTCSFSKSLTSSRAGGRKKCRAIDPSNDNKSTSPNKPFEKVQYRPVETGTSI